MSHVLRISSEPAVHALSKRLLASIEAGKDLKVEVAPWENKRSLEQNALYWATLTEIAREAPAHMDGVYHSPEVWHEYFRRRFLPMLAGPDGEGIPTSTRSLKVSEMADYITQIQAWIAEELHA